MEWPVWVLLALLSFALVAIAQHLKAKRVATETFLSNFWYCSIDEMAALISAGADVNGTTRGFAPGRWHRPLHALATRDDSEVNLEKIALLLNNGADVNGLDHLGRTPLTSLVESHGVSADFGSVASLLVASGARVDYKDDSGAGLIHIAARRGRHRVTKALLDAGSDVTALAPLTSRYLDAGVLVRKDRDAVEYRNIQDATPLLFAIEGAPAPASRDASLQVVQVLIEYGADPDHVTEDGVTAKAILERKLARLDEVAINGVSSREGYRESLENLRDSLGLGGYPTL